MGNQKSIIYTAPRCSGKSSALLRLVLRACINKEFPRVKCINATECKRMEIMYSELVSSSTYNVSNPPMILPTFTTDNTRYPFTTNVFFWDEPKQGDFQDRSLFKELRRSGIRQVIVMTPRDNTIQKFFDKNPEDFVWNRMSLNTLQSVGVL
jgi:hypothetical protein